LRHLRGRPRPAGEVRAHLARHGHAPATVAAVVHELEERGLVDDVRYAQWFVDGRLSHRPTGRARLVRELCARGVAREIAEAAAERGVGDREPELAWAAARSRAVVVRRLGRERGLRRLAAFLSQRGFTDAVVRDVCLKLFASDPAAPPDRDLEES
jgi:regulatory protein